MGNANDEIKILIAVSNHILCEGLRRILLEEGERNALCLNEFAGQFAPDILVFDSHQNVQRLLADFAEAKAILIDTCLSNQEIAFLFNCHNIRGIIAPESSVRLFQKAISVVNRGELWVDQKHLKNLLLRGPAAVKADILKMDDLPVLACRLLSSRMSTGLGVLQAPGRPSLPAPWPIAS